MKQFLVTIIFLLIVSLRVSAQKEVYFNSTHTDSISIKSLQGVNIGIGLLNGFVGYEKERKLSNNCSLIFSGTAIISRYSHVSYYVDSLTQHKYQGKITYDYGVSLSVSAQPRWYFDYIKRYQRGADTRLNSGWFLGLPITLQTTELDLKEPFDVMISLSPIVGFRKAFSRKFFLEGTTGVGIMNNIFDTSNLRLGFILELKTAYIL